MNFNDLVQQVLPIAKAAGEAILEIYHQPEAIGTTYKADDSPLTLADQASNQVICEGLQTLSIQYPIVSEENKAIPYAERKDYDYFWMVDPLDGTKEFIKRNGEFTVNIALIHEQRSILGVVYVPCTEELFYAVKGQGAYLIKDGQSRRLEVKTFTTTDANLRIVCSRSHLNEATQAFVDQYETPELIARGSSLKFTSIAAGEAHLYPRLAPTMEWDTAAAQIVLEEAGGAVIQAENGAPVQYNKENLLNPHFIALGKRQ